MTRFNASNGGLKTHKVTVRLDEKRFLELDRKVIELGTSVSFIIRHLVVRYLENEQRFGSRTLNLADYFDRREFRIDYRYGDHGARLDVTFKQTNIKSSTPSGCSVPLTI